MDPNTLVYGTPEPPIPVVRAAAGPLAIEVEPDTGTLRHASWQGVEFLRGIYATVRTAHWGTIIPEISDFAVEHTGEGFRIAFRAEHHGERDRAGEGGDDGGRIELTWRGEIAGDRHGALSYSFDATAGTAFMTNRTGVCVLHPEGLKGTRVEIAHPDASCETGVFPELISPDWPFRDIAGITCEPYPSGEVTIRFEGETFEMEDQRNWSDNSYKTYCYPQSRPFPYPIEAGQKIRQVVRIQCRGELPKHSELPAPEFATPRLGTMMAGSGSFEGLGLSLVACRPEGLEAARATGLPVTVVADAPRDLREGETLAIAPPPGKEGHVAASMNNFTELNRDRPKDPKPGVLFANTPQVHQFDSRVLFEAPHTFGDLVATARSFTDGPVILGPTRMSAQREDPRWNSLVGVGWTLACYAAAVARPSRRLSHRVARPLREEPCRGSCSKISREAEVEGFEGARWTSRSRWSTCAWAARLRVSHREPHPRGATTDPATDGGGSNARVLDAANVADVASPRISVSGRSLSRGCSPRSSAPTPTSALTPESRGAAYPRAA